MNPQSSQLISQTLQLPHQLPLFKYNINFSGVKKLLEQANIQINTNKQSINKINESLNTKLQKQIFKEHQSIMNHSIKFGVNIEKYINKKDNQFLQFKVNSDNSKNKSDALTNTTQFANKVSKLSEIIDHLLMKTQQNENSIANSNTNHTKSINQQFSRLQQKLSSSLQSFTKTINNYFSESNKKSSSLQSQFNITKSSTQQKITQFQLSLNNKISQSLLSNRLQIQKQNILQQFQSKLQSDQMSRLSFIQQYKNQLKQLKKDIQVQNKLTKQKVTEMQVKVKQSLTNKSFQMEKHKIYQKLSQFKNKNQQFTRKNNQFYDFRKNYLIEKQKIKQDIIGIQDQLKKINDNQGSFKKIQNVTDLLNKFDPHLICQIMNQVKLHQKQIGKLQKSIMLLQSLNKSTPTSHNSLQKPLASGQNSQMIQKIIKQYMNNMSFQTRTKKVQKDIIQISRRTDIFNDLQKKIYTLSKDLDTTALTKQIKKKCDQQSTKKQFKILDGKIQNLFDYFKHIRRQLDLVYKKTAFSTSQKQTQSPSLTSKKLISANCLSCTTTNHQNYNSQSHNQKLRTYSRKKVDYSFDQGIDYLKSATYNKMK